MYEELIRNLRICQDGEHCDRCGYYALKMANGLNACTETLCKQAADAIEDLLAALTASNEVIAKSKPRWIPVAERYPEDREMVVGFTPCDGFMFVGYHFSYKWGSNTVSKWRIITAMRSTKDITKKVTHWMPLPPPPEEET